MTTFNPHALRSEIKSAQDASSNLALLTTRYSDFDLPAAYEVARLLHQARLAEGAIPIGRKIGFTNPQVWDSFGIREPLWGYLYNKTVTHVSSTHVQFKLGQLVSPKLEPEIVVHFHTKPPVTASVSELLECIDWIAHGIEIVQSHYPDWRFQAADAVANSVMHGALIVGEHRNLNTLGPDLISALERFSLSLSCGGKSLETATGANVLGSPLKAVAYVLAAIHNQGQWAAIQAGELITTGTITKAFSIQPGESWRTEFDGIELPGMTIEFEK